MTCRVLSLSSLFLLLPLTLAPLLHSVSLKTSYTASAMALASHRMPICTLALHGRNLTVHAPGCRFSLTRAFVDAGLHSLAHSLALCLSHRTWYMSCPLTRARSLIMSALVTSACSALLIRAADACPHRHLRPRPVHASVSDNWHSVSARRLACLHVRSSLRARLRSPVPGYLMVGFCSMCRVLPMDIFCSVILHLGVVVVLVYV
ncbi:hypothetical protein EVG20_g8631 [Dentipellis fragilis]|uniref:Uncharacterized protein n=1 Tax=Dentipellis fragilis TaxID=205917 RepID=A0A4Y9Y5Y4_9AGAM|nr:hypothetical protein EVG20_g8631 [Dentipellis fragilis]